MPAAEIDALIAALENAPRRLRSLPAHAETRWRAAPHGGWSAIETLGHLRAADEIVAPRLLQVAVRDEPFLLAWDERRWQEVVAYETLAPARLIAAFTARREELVHALRRLPAAAWERIGLHEERGQLTLLTIGLGLAAHEAEHLDQIESALAGPA